MSYATADGTAKAGTDYTSKSATLVFTDAAPGERTFTVRTTDDILDESNEAFKVSISSPSGGGGPAPTLNAARQEITTTIIDDDITP